MTLVKEDFVTNEIDATFNVLESEWGDVWFYGHDDEAFIDEANRFFSYYALGSADLLVSEEDIEHTWAVAKYVGDGAPGTREFYFDTVAVPQEGAFPVSVIRS